MTTEPTIELERTSLRRLLTLVADRARREREIESLHASEVSSEQRQYHEVFQLLSSTYEAEQVELQQGHVTRRDAVEERWQAEATAIEVRFREAIEEIDSRHVEESTLALKERDEAAWLVRSLLDEDTDDSPLARLQVLQSGMVASRIELQTALKSLDGWYRQATEFLQRSHLQGEAVPPPPSTLPLDMTGLHQKCVESVRESEPLYHRLMGRVLPSVFRGFWPVVAFVVLSGLLFGVIRSSVDPAWLGLKLQEADRDWQYIAGGAGAALSLVSLFLLHLFAGQRALPDYDKLLQLAVDGDTAYQRWVVASQRELERQEADLAHQQDVRQHQRDAGLARADDRMRIRIQAAEARRDEEHHAAKAHYPARLTEIERTRQSDRLQAESRFESAWRDSLLRREQDFRRLQAEFDQRVAVSRQAYQQNWLELVREWRATLGELGCTADRLWETMRRVCPDWTDVARILEDPSQSHVGHAAGVLPSAQSDEAGSALRECGLLSECDLLSLGRVVADLEGIEQGTSPDPRLKTDRTRFDLPILVPLASRPSLVVRSNGGSRAAATRLLQTTMLRYLTSLPPGKVRFTILDPVGLGANFASFMHLADIDEQLVTSRIWTEPPHIEKRLADLTDHMETVIQTYLRNEYPTLDDYNRQAGEVAEPYRVLVVANFPTNFTEVSLRRLVSIADGGVRCGVFLLVSIDESQPLPRGFSISDLERHAIVLRLPRAASSSGEKGGLLQELLGETDDRGRPLVPSPPSSGERERARVRGSESAERGTGSAEREGDGKQSASSHSASSHSALRAPHSALALSPFRLADPDLGQWPLQFDEPPAADEFGKIVRLAGELARSVRRVEVPFERVMPKADAYWTSSSRAGLDIPIGRAGATKLQHLRLGKGTSQHVLVAGKTGSGKSSLLHALITNAALHYSPDEVEFYLIDFKKGVEFKTYATHRLTHARVIAIESDREFGVSVLQRLDGLLKERGELFRRAGVQDLAGYRDVNPDQPLPRVMLVIDEFQEFFTDEDALSQQAALLLDRLIRQGRAFGVHVLLGSQTLAGAYSLARSTLGQIAVRIALQCSETDAHLILSEDNTAARLLSRPGEAIYNDANGLVEGNHPFQVVWLDDSQRETYLGWLREWSDEFQRRESAHVPSPPSSGERARVRGSSPSHAARWPDAIVFEGNIAADPLANPLWLEAVRPCLRLPPLAPLGRGAGGEGRSRSSPPTTFRCWLGDSVSLTGPLELRFGPRDGGPVLLIGRDDEAALGVLASSLLALAGQGASAQPEGRGAKFVVLDGSLPDSSASKTWRVIAELGTQGSFDIVAPREAAAALQSVVAELRSRTDDLAPPVFVIVYDIARFRDLKKAEDDFGGYGGFDKEQTVNPSALWAEIVKDGPAAGVFPIVWCDGYQTAQRWLGRELLNRFETRVLFAMNANDSSNLIDTPAASKLGPNRALLSRGDLGTVEKFRPYGILPPETIADLTQPERPANTDQESDGSTREDNPPAPTAESHEDLPAESNSNPNGDRSVETAIESVETPTESESPEWTSLDELNVL